MDNNYILIISAVFPPEPVVSARLSADIQNSLDKRGYHVRILHPVPTRPEGFHFDKKKVSCVNEVTVNSYTCPQSKMLGRLRESYSFGKACAAYIHKQYKELSCIYVNSWPLFSQRAIVKAAKKHQIPCIIHVQDVYPESLTNKLPLFLRFFFYRALIPFDRYILKNCSRIIAISDKMKSYLSSSRGVSEDKISVIINWQDESDYLCFQRSASLHVSNHPFTFMFMGNIGPVAGVDLLIDSFVNANLNNARLVIAGSGSMKEKLMEYAKPFDNILFWDVPNGKVPEVQGQADVLLLPIKKGAASSSIPSKLPAYMFSAKPIIACVDNDSDTAESIRSAKCGFVIEPENVMKLSSAMMSIATLTHEKLNYLGNNGQEYALLHFSKSVNLEKLIKVIIEQNG